MPLLDDRSVRYAPHRSDTPFPQTHLLGNCSTIDKVRIIALYIMHRDGVPEGDKKRLYQHARLAIHEMDAIDNLSYLGLNVNKVGSEAISLYHTARLLIKASGLCRTRARSGNRCSSSEKRRTPTTSRGISLRCASCSRYVQSAILLRTAPDAVP